MTTADLISANAPTPDRPAWAHKGEPGWLAVRVAAGDVQKAALDIDADAARLGIQVAEVARVLRDGVEIVFARGDGRGDGRAAVTAATQDTLEKSKTLDTFLSKAITETKTMNKFAELAARSASIRKALDDRADALGKRLDAIPTLADTAFSKHEQILDATESGIKDLEDSLRDLAGHNGAPLGDTSQSLPFVAPKSDAA